jgi:hypothetical protein
VYCQQRDNLSFTHVLWNVLNLINGTSTERDKPTGEEAQRKQAQPEQALDAGIF